MPWAVEYFEGFQTGSASFREYAYSRNIVNDEWASGVEVTAYGLPSSQPTSAGDVMRQFVCGITPQTNSDGTPPSPITGSQDDVWLVLERVFIQGTGPQSYPDLQWSVPWYPWRATIPCWVEGSGSETRRVWVVMESSGLSSTNAPIDMDLRIRTRYHTYTPYTPPA